MGFCQGGRKNSCPRTGVSVKGASTLYDINQRTAWTTCHSIGNDIKYKVKIVKYINSTSTFSTTVTAVATVATVAAATVATTMTTIMAFFRYSFRLQGLQLKLRNFALAAAGPHTRPLAVAFLWWLLAALTTGIVNTCSKLHRECHWFTTVAAASTATATGMMANFRASEATTTVATSTTSRSSCY